MNPNENKPRTWWINTSTYKVYDEVCLSGVKVIEYSAYETMWKLHDTQQSHNGELREEIEQLASALAAKDKEIAELRENLEYKTNHAKGLQYSFNCKQEENQKLKAELEYSNARISELYSAWEKKSSQLESAVSALEFYAKWDWEKVSQHRLPVSAVAVETLEQLKQERA